MTTTTSGRDPRWGLPFEPTDDQVAAIEAVIEWWNERPDEQVFRLFGYAGTGKTSIAIYLPHVLQVSRYRFGAFSGKAVNVLQTKMVRAEREYSDRITEASNLVDEEQLAEDMVSEWAGAEPASPEHCATLHKLLYGPPVDLKKENARLEEKIEALREGVTRATGDVVALTDATRRLGFEGISLEEARAYVREFEDQIRINTRTAKARGWLYFAPQEQSPLNEVDLLIADEVSMVSDDMAHDILSTGVRVLVLGDPEQLPPVRGNGYFVRQGTQPDAMLQTVTRQAAGSPVLSIATQVRAGVDTATWMVPWKDVDHAAFAENDAVILCWRRATRWGAIHYVRERLLGRPAGVPVPGDKIMVLANNSDIGVFNGQTFVVDEVEENLAADPEPKVSGYATQDDFAAEPVVDVFESGDPDVLRLLVHEEGVPDSQTPLEVYRFGFLGDREEKDAGAQRLGSRGKVALATFAQAVTVHKAQGSEWGRVLFIDEGRAMFGMESNRGGYDYAERQVRRFRYTAITRARDAVTIVRKS